MCDRTLKSTITSLQAHCPSPSSTCSSIPTVSSSSLSPSLPFPFFSSSFPLLSFHPVILPLFPPSLSLLFSHFSLQPFLFFICPPFPTSLFFLLSSSSSLSLSLSSFSFFPLFSSLFCSSKIESCFSSPHVSDFPEWQKVALSSPPPREAFVPPHLEPRVRVSPPVGNMYIHVHIQCTNQGTEMDVDKN